MEIGLFSPRQELLQEQLNIIQEFNKTACLDLMLRTGTTPEELEQLSNNIPLDILVFDMDTSEATSQLEHFVQILPHCKIFLLCSDNQYAVFGYAIHATDYQVLPLESEAYLSTMIYLIRTQLRQREQFLPAKINGVWSQLNTKHITHLESRGHHLIIHLNNDKEIKLTASFRDYESLLALNVDFLRCHKSYMVNLAYVTKWETGHFYLKDGTAVNISRPYWQIARSVYACYQAQTEDIPLSVVPQ